MCPHSDPRVCFQAQHDLPQHIANRTAQPRRHTAIYQFLAANASNTAWLLLLLLSLMLRGDGNQAGPCKYTPFHGGGGGNALSGISPLCTGTQTSIARRFGVLAGFGLAVGPKHNDRTSLKQHHFIRAQNDSSRAQVPSGIYSRSRNELLANYWWHSSRLSLYSICFSSLRFPEVGQSSACSRVRERSY